MLVWCSIPFFIAAPVTTLDSNLPSGAKIVIEHRPGSEITSYNGQQIAAEGIEVSIPSVLPVNLTLNLLIIKRQVG